MAKLDDRPIDAGLAAQRGKDEPALVEWWKERFGLIAGIPQDTARVGALMPALRELATYPEADRKKLTRARMLAFAQLPADARQLIVDTRTRAQAVDPALLASDQKVVDEIAPTLDASVRSAYPGAH